MIQYKPHSTKLSAARPAVFSRNKHPKSRFHSHSWTSGCDPSYQAYFLRKKNNQPKKNNRPTKEKQPNKNNQTKNEKQPNKKWKTTTKQKMKTHNQTKNEKQKQKKTPTKQLLRSLQQNLTLDLPSLAVILDGPTFLVVNFKTKLDSFVLTAF